MDFLNSIKELIPDYAKDIRLNLDGTIARSSLPGTDAVGVALAAAFAAGSRPIMDAIKGSGMLPAEEMNAALTAAALMGMNNVWYPFVDMTHDADMKNQPAQLRMNAYATHGGADKRRFEMYALAASIVGKCGFCIRSHFNELKQEGMTTEQLRDIGRIAAVVNAAAQVITASK
jgi:alkyl hydroperoxide reductase subunit D